jgi:glycine cleavage system H lipoate-binding protein
MLKWKPLESNLEKDEAFCTVEAVKTVSDFIFCH